MNIQEYIASGIVEAYVLGLATPQERDEFERMCAMHAEVKAAREAFEISLEEYALLNQIQPPRNLKGKVFAAIDIESEQQDKGVVNLSTNNDNAASRSSGRQAKVVALPNWSRYLSAAAVVLLLISVGINFYLFNRYQEYNNRYQALVDSQSQLANTNNVLQTKISDYERAINLMKDPYMAIVKMPAAAKSPDSASLTTIYWNTVSKDVYLVVNHLPAPAAEQQYQLWALVDGKPVDAGVIDLANGVAMAKMKNIPRADAFAITLEKRGGSPTPNLQQLFVLGKV